MAQKITTVCDRDHRHLADRIAVPFTFKGRNYLIDLCGEDLEAFEETMKPWIKAARKASSGNDDLAVTVPEARVPVPQLGADWWSDPPGKTNGEHLVFKRARAVLRLYGRYEMKIRIGVHGSLPEEVGYAWTKRWLEEHEAGDVYMPPTDIELEEMERRYKADATPRLKAVGSRKGK